MEDEREEGRKKKAINCSELEGGMGVKTEKLQFVVRFPSDSQAQINMINTSFMYDNFSSFNDDC